MPTDSSDAATFAKQPLTSRESTLPEAERRKRKEYEEGNPNLQPALP